jgi:hypothetical protein
MKSIALKSSFVCMLLTCLCFMPFAQENSKVDIIYAKRSYIQTKCTEALKQTKFNSKNANDWQRKMNELLMQGSKAEKLSKKDLMTFTKRVHYFLNAIDSVNQEGHSDPKTERKIAIQCDYCPSAGNLPPNAPCTAVCGAYRNCCLSNSGCYEYNPQTGLCETDSWPCDCCVGCNFENLLCYLGCVTRRPPKQPLTNYYNDTKIGY